MIERIENFRINDQTQESVSPMDDRHYINKVCEIIGENDLNKKISRRLKTFLGDEFKPREVDKLYDRTKEIKGYIGKIVDNIDINFTLMQKMSPKKIVDLAGVPSSISPEIYEKIQYFVYQYLNYNRKSQLIKTYKEKYPDASDAVADHINNNTDYKIDFEPNEVHYLEPAPEFGLSVVVPNERNLEVCAKFSNISEMEFGAAPAALNTKIPYKHEEKEYNIPFIVYHPHSAKILNTIKHEDYHSRNFIFTSLVGNKDFVQHANNLNVGNDILLTNERFLEGMVKNEFLGWKMGGKDIEIKAFLPTGAGSLSDHKEYADGHRACLKEMLRKAYKGSQTIEEYKENRQVAYDAMNNNFKIVSLYKKYMDRIFQQYEKDEAALICDLVPMSQYQVLKKFSVEDEQLDDTKGYEKGRIREDNLSVEYYCFQNEERIKQIMMSLNDIKLSDLNDCNEYIYQKAHYGKGADRLSLNDKNIKLLLNSLIEEKKKIVGVASEEISMENFLSSMFGFWRKDIMNYKDLSNKATYLQIIFDYQDHLENPIDSYFE